MLLLSATGGTGAFQYSDDDNTSLTIIEFDDFQAGNYVSTLKMRMDVVVELL